MPAANNTHEGKPMSLIKYHPTPEQQFATALGQAIYNAKLADLVGVKGEWKRGDPAEILASSGDAHYVITVRYNGPRRTQ